MLNLDEIGSNLPHLVRILLRKWFSLLSRVFTPKIWKSLVLIEMKAKRIRAKEEKRFTGVPRAKKARVKGRGECTFAVHYDTTV